MRLIKRTLVDPATYRRLAYLVSALVLGPTWFVALVTMWSLSLGLAITPFVIPALLVLALMTRGFAAADRTVRFHVEQGAGKLGLGGGESTSHEGEHEQRRDHERRDRQAER